MEKDLEYTYDKFTFRVRPGYRYSPDELWVRVEDGRAVVGVTDLLQQKSGDAAFVELVAVGAHVAAGEALGTFETVKATVILPAPLFGTVVEQNTELEDTPELVNQDPYGAGWLAVLRLDDPAAVNNLQTAEEYRALLPGKVAADGGPSGAGKS